jgi:hypothetical protein
VRALVGQVADRGARGQFPGVVHGLGEDLQLLVLAPAAGLQADVVNGGADYRPRRLASTAGGPSA